jgi:hypothetical protein
VDIHRAFYIGLFAAQLSHSYSSSSACEDDNDVEDGHDDEEERGMPHRQTS